MATNTKPTRIGVAKYVKNVGSSLALASIDIITDHAPAMKEFLKSNDEYIKKGFSYIRNPTNANNRTDKSIIVTKVYQAINSGIKNLKDDIKSGNIYNTTRDDDYISDMMKNESPIISD